MLAAGLVMLVLGIHGGEAPREVKFQGALLEQVAAQTPSSLTAGSEAMVVLCIGGGLLTSATMAALVGGWTMVVIVARVRACQYASWLAMTFSFGIVVLDASRERCLQRRV